MPVVVEVEELVTPLRDNPQRIFNEGTDNEEAPYGGDVPVQEEKKTVSTIWFFSSLNCTPVAITICSPLRRITTAGDEPLLLSSSLFHVFDPSQRQRVYG